MREFIADSPQDIDLVKNELRTDEILWDNGIQLGDFTFFTAVTDEDFMNKEEKLSFRKHKRREKRRSKWQGESDLRV